MDEAFQIKMAGFEGPFGLLLNLIEKRKLFINDVSLSAVTEDYLSYMNKLGGLSPAEVSSFVLVASTLLLIKSKSLLPNLDLTNEEEGNIKSLEERLRLYELFLRLGGNIKSDFGKKIIFAPNERKNENIIFLPDNQITRDSMMTFARDVLGAMPKKIFMPQVEVKTVISIEEMIDKLTERIKSALTMNFKDLSGISGRPATREEKVVVIVGFLAMLELVRQGIMEAMQETNGGDIIMTKQEIVVESL
ncbi:segregation/condensation protein A [Candidatus Nomurabacteria bacterium]|nr:segregation/condensation protein A [Candidatus Nomurabacteria bacterium]